MKNGAKKRRNRKICDLAVLFGDVLTFADVFQLLIILYHGFANLMTRYLLFILEVWTCASLFLIYYWLLLACSIF